MPNQHSFRVYDASAGSGKTFTLVKEYLKILFASTSNYQFKHILAITFTNKAVGEMKARIIEMLKLFSDIEILETPNSMFKAICEELPIEDDTLHKRSKIILNTIMHNYAAFDISTIDGFNHRLIRTFAYDLKLPLNFEVELDVKSLLNEAVDSLIAKAGSDKRLTKILVDFAIEKADDDKSWDVSKDFNSIANLLIKENDLEFIKTIEDKTLDDFKELKKLLISEIETSKKNIINSATSVLELITKNGLDFTDFTRGTLPNHFKKARELNFTRLYDNQLENNISERIKVYNKTLDETKASIIESILPQIEKAYHNTKRAVFNYKFLNAFYKNLTPLSVLNVINKELNILKEEQNKMLISEFNNIISKEISGQPTPFIYERMGEKFRHYFIDEFQDTSQMQWGNLIPLVENTLSGQNIKGEQGTAMLVGDAKQAIYRWRGGKAEQFIGLFNEDNPFHVEKQLENLPANYRSFENIVDFNNRFFEFLSTTVFMNLDYSNLYKHASQDFFIEEKGYVNLKFIDFDTGENRNDLYTNEVLESVNSCLENGYTLKDICILVRKKKEGIAIAEFLSSKGLKITSSETMLISNSPEVNFVNNLLILLVNPNDSESRLSILDFLAQKYSIKDKHEYFQNHIKIELTELFKSFESFGIFINSKIIIQQALYDVVETIVREFKLVDSSNAYIQFYLDLVLEYSQKNISDVLSFLDYFEKKKDSLSIVSPQNQDAIQIMTIHKSKGLEFPVVIFPYADLDIYREIEPKEWIALDAEKYKGFTHTLLNYNKDFELYGDVGNYIYKRHQAELELDNVNLLYVALTRPIEQLYVIGKKDIDSKGFVKPNTYSGMLINYLMQSNHWDNSKMEYSFGSQKRSITKAVNNKNETIELEEFISTAKQDHNIKVITNSGYLWDTNQEQAIEKGNLLHDIMEHIKTENDVDFAINDFITSGVINNEQADALRVSILQIINHPDLKKYYSESNTVYNERDIISKTGKIYRPDRLIINNENEVVIIDYKTGLHNPKYQHQLQDYHDVLEEMEFKVSKKILIYINKDITIKNYN
ncbi:exodeoxyribonuclease V subunit beta [uncultured Lacinutrix sp.]|uniref:UvrD-helicase domain-containing protein n=1 Tax=uncultured Lacinutrix sp. TaxID=574032 RepID=UPI0026093A04|nr:UvrD-helicase domain-containing protein [uncultured Lacinutrix sp.]